MNKIFGLILGSKRGVKTQNYNSMEFIGRVFCDSDSYKDVKETKKELSKWKYGESWEAEMLEMPKAKLLEILGDKNPFDNTANKASLIKEIRANLVVIDFNNEYPINSFVGWKEANLSIIQKAQVVEPARLVNGLPCVKIVLDGTSKALERTIDGYNLLYLIK